MVRIWVIHIIQLCSRVSVVHMAFLAAKTAHLLEIRHQKVAGSVAAGDSLGPGLKKRNGAWG